MAATQAAAAPEMAPKKRLAMMATKASPPENRPTMELAKFTSLREIPPNSMSDPARMKKGTAMRGKESAAVNIFWTRMTGGMLPDHRMAAREARPMETAMGTLRRKKRMRLPKRTVVMKLQPPFR
ncbi:hypothetical protein MASR2M79_09200 [Aminivibrio sp.]